MVTSTKAIHITIDGRCACPINYGQLPFCEGCQDDIEIYGVGVFALHWQGAHWHLTCAFDKAYKELNDKTRR